MEVVYQFGEHLFGFVLAGHVCEFDACFGLDVYLGVAFSEGHGIDAASAVHDFAHQELADGYHYNEGQNPGQQEGDEEGLLFYNFRAEGGSGCIKPVHKGRIFHRACFIETGG